MTATAEILTWNNVFPNELTPADGIRAYLGEFADDYDVDALGRDLSDYADSVLDKAGMSLHGSSFYGPADLDREWADEQARQAVEIAWEHLLSSGVLD